MHEESINALWCEFWTLGDKPGKSWEPKGGDARTGNGLQRTKQHVFESAPDKEMRNSNYNDELAAPWDWHMIPIDRGLLNESVSSWIHEGKLDLKLELECQKGESELYSFGNKRIKIVTKAGEW